MKKLIYIMIMMICIIVCFVLFYLSIGNLTKNSKYDKYGYEIANKTIYKLNLAIDENNIEKVKKIIKHTNLNSQPLKLLTYQEREDIIEDKGLNRDAEYTDSEIDYYNFPPLSNACRNKNIPIIKLLIENGADVNYLSDEENYEYSPLYATLDAYIYDVYNDGNDLDKYISVLQLLIDNNVQWDMKSENNPLLYLTSYNHLEENENATYNSLNLFKLIIKNSKDKPTSKIKGDILFGSSESFRKTS